jgi:hypothetical protein
LKAEILSMPRASVTQATIVRAVKAAQAAGLPVARFEVARDGTVTVFTVGSGAPKAGANDWDTQ